MIGWSTPGRLGLFGGKNNPLHVYKIIAILAACLFFAPKVIRTSRRFISPSPELTVQPKAGDGPAITEAAYEAWKEKWEAEEVNKVALVKMAKLPGVIDLDGDLTIKNKPARTLNLRDVLLGNQGVNALVELMRWEKEPCPYCSRRLRSLNLGSNEIGDSGAQAISSVLKRNRKILRLYLDVNRISDPGAVAIGEMLSMNVKLERLYLWSNRIRAKGAVAIAQGLASNSKSKLESLYLDSNDMGDGGAKAIADMLAKRHRMTELGLRDVGMTTEGAIAVFRGVGESSRVETLDVSKNNIGPDAGAAIRDMLLASTKMKRLDLSENRLGDQGTKVIAAALKKNSSLQALWLHDNDIGDEGIHALLSALKVNVGLRTLWVRANPRISEEVLDKLKLLTYLKAIMLIL